METLLSEKNDQVSVFLSSDRELSKVNVRIEELEADVAGKTRLLQDRTQEVKQLKEQMEQVETELRTRKSDAPRDSFGSFVDTHNVRASLQHDRSAVDSHVASVVAAAGDASLHRLRWSSRVC